MRKTILLSAALACGALTASAQEYLMIDNQYIPVTDIDSITYEDFDYRTAMLPSIMAKDKNISIFNEALALTKVDELMCDWIDDSYSVGADSIDWTNRSLVIATATEYDNVAYPKERRKKFTAFVETDEVYKAAGINNIDDLKAYAKKIYDEVYPEDANITDPTDRRNSLNRFVSYHFLNRYGEYYTLTSVDGSNSLLAMNWDRTKWDIADWYETMMPHSIMKLSFPDGSEQGLYVNRRGVQSHADSRGVKVRGAMITHPDQMDIDPTAVNGIYHYIDQIIHYGKETQEVVLNENVRIDASTLSPDFMNSGARGHKTRTNYSSGMYGCWDNNNTINNKQTCLGFKAGSAENFTYTDETHLHVRPRTLSFWSYQGDEVTIKGIYDVTVKLPPVPAGTYELRLGTCVDFQSRGIVQFYLDGETCGEPVDFRFSGNSPVIGWRSDDNIIKSYPSFNFTEAYCEYKGWDIVSMTYDEVQQIEKDLREWQNTDIVAYNALRDSLKIVFDVNIYDDSELDDATKLYNFDQKFRSRGWMKAPASYYSSSSESGGYKGTRFRDASNLLRRIICTFTTDGKTEHYLRIKQMMDSENNELDFDYIELCPKSVYASVTPNDYIDADGNLTFPADAW